jgi:hypothetical protein
MPQDTSRATVVTRIKETSPAISQEEERFRAYVQTDSDERLERLVNWTSASPALNIPEVAVEHNAIKVNSFADPSTIEE